VTKWDMTLEEDVLSRRCMLKANFNDNKCSKKNYDRICNNPKGALCSKGEDGVVSCEPRPKACDLPLSQIPDRSVKRRLESPFCIKYPKADVCQP